VIHGLVIDPMLMMDPPPTAEADLDMMNPDEKWMPHITVTRAAQIVRENPKQFASQYCERVDDEELTALVRLAQAYLELGLEEPLSGSASVPMYDHELDVVQTAIDSPGWNLLAGPRHILNRVLSTMRSRGCA